MTNYYDYNKPYTQEEFQSDYVRTMRLKNKDDICLIWNYCRKGIGHFNITELSDQIKEWNTDTDTLFSMKKINNAKMVDGKMWYVCLLREDLNATDDDETDEEEDLNATDDDEMEDAIIFGTFDDRHAYAFATEEMRDWCFECVNTRAFTNFTNNPFPFVEAPPNLNAL